MIKCGIIGYGKMGRIRAKAVEESGRGKVVGIYDTGPLSECPYRKFSSDVEVIHDPEVEAVFVCTPNYRIVPLVENALQAGKHVFSEKPPAFNAMQVAKVMEVERVSAGILMYGFNHRHHESIRKMKTIVDSGEMGRILWMRGRYGKEVDDLFFEGWRANKDLAGGGIMLDQGIHMLDLFLHFAGDFDEVYAFVSNLFWKIEGIEDNCFAIFRDSRSGICASLHSTMTQWRYLFSLEIFLERGALILNGLKTSSGAYGDEDLAIKHNVEKPEEGRFEREEHIIYRTDRSWESEIEMFFDAIETGSCVPLGNTADALKLMTVMDKIYGDRRKAQGA